MGSNTTVNLFTETDMVNDLEVAIKERLISLQSEVDKESAHVSADNAISLFVYALGFKDISKEFDKIEKWYA